MSNLFVVVLGWKPEKKFFFVKACLIVWTFARSATMYRALIPRQLQVILMIIKKFQDTKLCAFRIVKLKAVEVLNVISIFTLLPYFVPRFHTAMVCPGKVILVYLVFSISLNLLCFFLFFSRRFIYYRKDVTWIYVLFNWLFNKLITQLSSSYYSTIIFSTSAVYSHVYIKVTLILVLWVKYSDAKIWMLPGNREVLKSKSA